MHEAAVPRLLHDGAGCRSSGRLTTRLATFLQPAVVRRQRLLKSKGLCAVPAGGWRRRWSPAEQLSRSRALCAPVHSETVAKGARTYDLVMCPLGVTSITVQCSVQALWLSVGALIGRALDLRSPTLQCSNRDGTISPCVRVRVTSARAPANNASSKRSSLLVHSQSAFS